MITGVLRRGPQAVRALGALALTALMLAGCATEPPAPPVAPGREPPDRLTLTPARFADLPGWAQDDPVAALPALARSCRVITRLPADRAIGPDAVGGRAGDWQAACAALPTGAAATPAAARQFFETWFHPFRAVGNRGADGLFTGYYEPELVGARTRSPTTPVPLLRRPDDLVMVELGDWRTDLRGQRVAGRVRDGRLIPYATRAEIDAGALANRGLELIWVSSAIDAFFLHIQGSGAVRLPDGSRVRVGYAAQNGHAYVPIGRPMVERGLLPRDGVSMQSIRAWLEANPADATAIMNLNPSYIFFRETPDGPVGAQGVTLVPGRSLAIDPAFLPLGAPLWLDIGDEAAPGGRLQRLVIAQDTGGAIRGPVRGDVFWGTGVDAGERAGRYRQTGSYWLLLPRSVTPPQR
ncbi:MAG: murein transglycosylase [Alphaproteobacteria bacterium]|nr:MAG: murein transglycosylase [Alphaproteobacteria bacterium]